MERRRGKPPNESGIKSDYLWREVLVRESLANILENYAQVAEAKEEKTGRKRRTQVWPRYHQLDVVPLSRSSARATRSPTGPSGTAPSTATP